jgi:hypothetical protein
VIGSGCIESRDFQKPGMRIANRKVQGLRILGKGLVIEFIMIFNKFAVCSLYCSPLDENGVVASGSGGNSGGAEAVNENTPIENSNNAEMMERHRHIFNLRVFPSLFEGPKNNEKIKAVKDHPKSSPFSLEMTQAEWEETINIVLNFGPRLIKHANEQQARFRNNLPYTKVKKWIKQYNGAPLIEMYKVEEFKMPGSDQTQYRLLRNHKRLHWNEKKWLPCLPQLEVFDAIHECHTMVLHMKQNQTCAKVHEKYYNITEKQVIAFVETCFVCNQANSVARPLKRVKKLRSSDSMQQNEA